MEKVALFDFDGTICPGDSVIPYLLFCIREKWAPRCQLLKAGFAFIAQKLHISNIATAKSVTLSFLKGRSVTEADELARRFMREKLQPRFYRDAVAEINRLRSENVKTIVISASAEAWMRVLPEFLPVDEVISTPCLIDQDGQYNGQVPVNCRGTEKLRLLRQKHPETVEIVAAYGDSNGDIPMLKVSDQANLINPKSSLLKQIPQAKVRRWR